MCLTIRKSKTDTKFTFQIKVASRSIPVYKVLGNNSQTKTKGVSPYKNTTYREGQTYTSPLSSQPSFLLTKVSVEQGLHAYTTLKAAKNIMWDNRFIVKMIIPRGAVYIRGMHGTIVSTKLHWPRP